ncbi:MAG: serine/threonine-protein kinase [Kiritimatiellaeota bacterium]|nr:serine/threonine-protein kinase [Kiritimatiellota bacterium]
MADKESIEVIADRVEKVACTQCGHHMDVSALPMFTQFACPQCHTRQMVPGRLGAFLLLERLGSGGMGAVYRGLDSALGREVAIKIMHRSLGADPQFVENFLREARAAAAVNHRNVVQIFSFGQEKGQPYLVMELVNGGRLDSLITDGQALDEAKALALALDLAQGLQAAQDQGLMHGDIKPANILFDRAGTAKLVDFGLASFIRQQKTVSKEIWGTPFYLAPEKARRQKADHRADIYSLGATLYHALAVHPPFDGETATQVVLARLQAPPPDIGVARPDLHPATSRIVNRMLAPDPFLRYPNYPSLIADLQEAQQALRAEPAVHTPPAAAVPHKNNLFLWIGTGAAGVALLLFALLWNPHSAPPSQLANPTGQVHAVTAVPATNMPAPATNRPTAIASTPAADPFSPEEAKLLVAAVAPLARGDVRQVTDRLDGLHQQALTNRNQQLWISLFQAIALRAGDRIPEAERILQALDTPAAPGAPDPALLPWTLAAFLLGKLDQKTLTTEMARQPAWYGALAHFVMGLELLRRAQPEPAAQQFAAYQPPSAQTPLWPFAFQPLAVQWKSQCQNLHQVITATSRQINKQQFQPARAALEALRSQISPFLGPLIQQQLDKVNAAEQKLAAERQRAEAERQRAEQAAQQALAQKEIETVQALPPTLAPLVRRYNFAGAAERAAAGAAALQTAAGRAAGEQLVATCRQLEALHRFVIRRLSAAQPQPFVDRELGGSGGVQSADADGLQIALGTAGSAIKPWGLISPRVFIRMADYSLANRGAAGDEYGRHLLALAFFCRETGDARLAQRRAAQAVQADASLQPTAQLLFPTPVAATNAPPVQPMK